jgi:hypothetical protein
MFQKGKFVPFCTKVQKIPFRFFLMGGEGYVQRIT